MAYLEITKGRRIYFEHYEAGPLTAVLIHGWGASCRVWDSTLSSLLSAGISVLSFDQRGCGKSDKDFAVSSIAASADDTIRLCRHVGADRLILNGWSLGGAVAVAAAETLGESVIGVVSTAGATPRYTSASDFPHGNPPEGVHDVVKRIKEDRVTMLSGIAGAVAAGEPSRVFVDWLTTIFMETSPIADSALLDLAALEQRDKLAALKVPFLSIVGGKDIFVEPEIGRYAARLAPKGQLFEMPECGHAPFLEDGETYRKTLLDFVTGLC